MRQFRKRLGDMLVEEGLLTAEQLTQTLAAQKGSGLKLGDYLIDHNIVDEEQIIKMLSNQLHLERYDPEHHPVDAALAAIIPRELASQYQVAPLSKDAFVVRIAMVDPMNIAALDAVEKHIDMEVEPLICARSDFPLLLNGIYGMHSAVSEALYGLDEDVQVSSEESETEVIGAAKDMADAAPVIRLVNSILRQAVQGGASDIHISPEKNRPQIRLRIDGKLHEIPPPPRTILPGVISRLKVLANMDIANTRIPQDGRFNIRIDNKEVNIRASTLPTIYGENLVLRLLYVSAGALPLAKLGLDGDDLEKIRHMSRQPYGLILSVGPTGSGKSSTLYAVLQELIAPEINVVTLEDPVEFRMDGVRQVQLNRRAGMTFASGLRSILRQDPDIILVGETRDRETAEITMQSALTGHLVLSTLHTNDAVSTITRLEHMEIERFIIATSTLGIIAQRLLRRLCPHCAEPFEPTPEILAYWGLSKIADPDFRKPKGCSLCLSSGYKGRIGIFEILLVDEAVQEMIVQRMSSTEMSKILRDQGKLTLLREVAARKVAAGVTSFEEAARTVLT